MWCLPHSLSSIQMVHPLNARIPWAAFGIDSRNPTFETNACHDVTKGQEWSPWGECVLYVHDNAKGCASIWMAAPTPVALILFMCAKHFFTVKTAWVCMCTCVYFRPDNRARYVKQLRLTLRYFMLTLRSLERDMWWYIQHFLTVSRTASEWLACTLHSSGVGVWICAPAILCGPHVLCWCGVARGSRPNEDMQYRHT